MDLFSRPGVRAKKKARDRLIRLAQSHRDWVLGYQDETWWSRLAQPALHTWTPDEPLRLVERTADKSDPDPKALACYGLLRDDTGQMLLRFVGWDGFVTSRDVVACLRDAGLDIAEEVKSKGDLAKVQAQFNAWAEETGLPFTHLSRICALSVGENRSE